MYKYNLAFIIINDEVLLLNRNKSPWMGSWNGVGGKIEAGETIEASMIREIKEETNIDVNIDELKYKGVVTWNSFDAQGQGLYLFICNIKFLDHSIYPVKTSEGILDLKKILWASDKENYGIAHNIPYFLPHAINSTKTHEYHCVFEKNQLVDVIIKEI